MPVLQSFAVAALLAASSLGAGHAALAALRVASLLPERERDPIAVTLGAGVLGWVMFFPGVAGQLGPGALLAVAVCGLLGLALRPWRRPQLDRGADAWCVALLAVIAAVLVFDLAEGLSPPCDADTLAYHFALPKQFLAEGRIGFVPRAVDGAGPLLLHMTYVLALGLGGETGLTLWAMGLGWLPAWLLYAVARRHLSRRWALALAAIWLTSPAVIFGGGSGQMEPKLAAWAIVAGIATADAVRTRDARFAALAGLAAGLYLAAKLMGVIFVGACGLALLCQRRWLAHAATFSLVVALVGWQWYAWTYLHTGDPVFPALYDWLGAPARYWSAESAAFFRTDYLPEENPAPRTLLLLLTYPLVATLDGIPIWESARTGLGPFAWLMLPWALGALVLWRRRILVSPLFGLVIICGAFYVVWFLAGISQRIRHLLPLYPLVLLCIAIVVARLAERSPLRAPIAVAWSAVLALQFAGAVVFAQNYLRYQLTAETRQEFLERNVARFAPVPWINAHVPPNSRLLLTERQLVYHLAVPSYTAMARFQYQVDLLPGSSDPRRFLAELRALGITHILLAPSLADFKAGRRHIWTDELATYTTALVASGCAQVVHSEIMRAPRSRTLPALETSEVTSDVVALTDGACRL
jgi:hypothetical protein